MANSLEFVFIDTSFFKALVDQKDEFHKKAVRIWEKLNGENTAFITCNYVLDEAFTLIRIRCGLKKVNKFRELLITSSKDLRVLRVTVRDEADAWQWFLEDWSGLSFTDCVSFAVMKRIKVDKVLTFDKHFKRAGFDLLS